MSSEIDQILEPNSKIEKLQKSKNNQTLSSKDKIDAVLGITGGKSVDEFLDSLSLDTEAIHGTLETIDDKVKDSLATIDETASQLQQQTNTSSSILQLKSLDLSLCEIEEMINLSKQIFKHIADSILTTDLVDSELVQAASKLLESIHINISEFISIYQSKQHFVDKIKTMILQQEQKKELMLLKHKLDMEKIKAKDTQDPMTIEAEGTITFDQTEIIRKLSQLENDEI